MNCIKASVRINEYQDINKRYITPAEALVLRHIHAAGMAQQAKISGTPEELANTWKFLTNVRPDGTAETEVEGKKPTPRTAKDELARLRRLYLRKSADGKGHMIDDLFPGLNPELPETFSEIGLIVTDEGEEAPEPGKKKGSGPQLASKRPAEA